MRLHEFLAVAWSGVERERATAGPTGPRTNSIHAIDSRRDQIILNTMSL